MTIMTTAVSSEGAGLLMQQPLHLTHTHTVHARTRTRAGAQARAHTQFLSSYTRSRVVSAVSRDRDTASDVAAAGPISIPLPRCGSVSPNAPSEAPPPRTVAAAAGAGEIHRLLPY